MEVDFDELVIDDDTGLYLLEDRPYTGIALSHYCSGAVREEVPFNNGRQEGLCRERTEGGIVVCDKSVLGGLRHGPMREWYPSGAKRREAMYEFGICTSATDWDEAGNTVAVFSIDPKSANYQALEKLRSQEWNDPAVQRLLGTEP